MPGLTLSRFCEYPAKTVSELNGTLSQIPASVFVLHRDWIRTAGDRFVLDPGIPEVRDWITSIVAEVVEHYPVDGVQFDDYFYTESPGSALNDTQTYRRYGQGYASKADWRRHNTQQLIARCHAPSNSSIPILSLASVLRASGVTDHTIRQVPIPAARRRMMSLTPTPAAGFNRACLTTSPPAVLALCP